MKAQHPEYARLSPGELRMFVPRKLRCKITYSNEKAYI